jgi:hypothetical protein
MSMQWHWPYAQVKMLLLLLCCSAAVYSCRLQARAACNGQQH